VPVGQTEGLKHRSVVNADNLLTIPKNLLERRMGALTPKQMGAAEMAIKFALGLK
jgi:mRNA-degrading endonuclease toxin of MazEF toxin-antitoxin module